MMLAALLAAAAIEIAPLDEALTFARLGEGDEARLLAVFAHDGETIEAADITALAAGDDAIDLVNRNGYDALAAQIAAISARLTIDADRLTQPVRLNDAHIAVGTNYRAHAEEASVEGGPFLFPKLVAPTGPRAVIPWRSAGLLDYEVELCFVAMETLEVSAPLKGGLILCNDVTDRAILLAGINPKAPESGEGFPDGKGQKGFLPVGDLFVVPRDVEAFASGLSMSLSVNGAERQASRVNLWIWDLARIIAEARKAEDRRWAYGDDAAGLPVGPDGAIAARTLVLAGTPAGTVFDGFAFGDYAGGAVDWIASGFQTPIERAVIARYIRRSLREKSYLQPGDVVSARADRLGTLENVVGD